MYNVAEEVAVAVGVVPEVEEVGVVPAAEVAVGVPVRGREEASSRQAVPEWGVQASARRVRLFLH